MELNERTTMRLHNQLELEINAGQARRQAVRRRRAHPTARWWFAQMHRAVDEAAAGLPPSPVGSQALLPIAARN